jgi:hypothetical protein
MREPEMGRRGGGGGRGYKPPRREPQSFVIVHPGHLFAAGHHGPMVGSFRVITGTHQNNAMVSAWQFWVLRARAQVSA